MHMKTIALAAVASLLAVLSPAEQPNPAAPAGAATPSTNSAPWAADRVTFTQIQSMGAVIQEFILRGNGDYAWLADKLQAELDKLMLGGMTKGATRVHLNELTDELAIKLEDLRSGDPTKTRMGMERTMAIVKQLGTDFYAAPE
jgi:hypothetical protein